MNLADSTALYLGGTEVDKVYLGSSEIWPPTIVPSTAAIVGSLLTGSNVSGTALGPASGQAAGDTLIALWLRQNTTNPGLDGSNTHFTGSPMGGPGGWRGAFTYKAAADGTTTTGNTSNSVTRAALAVVRNSPAFAGAGVLDFSIANGSGTSVTVPVPAASIPAEGVKVVVMVLVGASSVDTTAAIGTSGLIDVGSNAGGWRILESSGTVTSFAGGSFAIASNDWSTITIYVR